MAGYWKDPELSFVSGTTVVKGWTTTLKRYREKYGDSRNLGRLTFEGLDVTPLTDDVAVVVGRFRLERADAADSGVFTLVMKRFEGMWRIVHDHSVGDPPPKS
jgi:beta-aspartyl-peptidase (threonine type)